jgi:hypothetical protein
MIEYNYSEEYYRFLARFVLDIGFRDRLLDKKDQTEIYTILKDAGFGLSTEDIKRILSFLKIECPIDYIIEEINGIPITIEKFPKRNLSYKMSAAENSGKVPPPTQVKPVNVVP